MTINHTLSGCLLLLGFLTACSLQPAVWVKETRELSVVPKAAKRLIALTHNGSIKASADAQQRTVKVIAVVQGGGANSEAAQAALDAIETFCIETGDAVSIGWKWKISKLAGWGAKVALEVTYPASLSASLETHNGNVTVTGAVSETDVLTHNGSIHFSGSVHQLDLETHNGGVGVVLATSGQLSGSIKTHNGSIDLSLKAGASTAITARTHNGVVRCDLAATHTSSGRANWSGTLGEGGGSLKITTHNGNVTLK